VDYLVTLAEAPGNYFSTDKHQGHHLLAVLTGWLALSWCATAEKRFRVTCEEVECAPRMSRRRQALAVPLFGCCPWRMEQNKAY